MYRLLIAEDEKQTREGLAYFFKNNSCGFEVAGIADGGLSALSMAEEIFPHAVLTDIRMPDLDGFSLAQRLSEGNPGIKIIIMSAYDDIEYFKSALKIKAVDYIMKPIDLQELTAVMNKTRESLDADSAEMQKQDRLHKQLEKNLPELRTHFFIDLVSGNGQSPDAMRERMSFLNISLPEDCCYCAVLVSLDNRTEIFGEDSQADSALSFGLRNLFEELVEIHSEGYVFEYREGEFVLLLTDDPQRSPDGFSDFEKRNDELIEALLKNLRSGLNMSATIGVGAYVNAVSEISKSFFQALRRVQERLFLGNNRIIKDPHTGVQQRRFSFRLLDEVCGLLPSSDPEPLKKAVALFFEELAADSKADVRYCIQCSGQLMMVASQTFFALHGNFEQEDGNILSAYEQLGTLETLSDMEQVTADYCLQLNRIIRDKMTTHNTDIVDWVKRIIAEHYKENFSIHDLAVKVYLSPNYLCALFKQETRQTINQYITEVRIREAKRLLNDPSVRLSDIGFEVGYSEPSYFSKIFKKYTALTPKEYQQMLMKQNRSTSVPSGE